MRRLLSLTIRRKIPTTSTAMTQKQQGVDSVDSLTERIADGLSLDGPSETAIKTPVIGERTAETSSSRGTNHSTAASTTTGPPRRSKRLQAKASIAAQTHPIPQQGTDSNSGNQEQDSSTTKRVTPPRRRRRGKGLTGLEAILRLGYAPLRGFITTIGAMMLLFRRTIVAALR